MASTAAGALGIEMAEVDKMVGQGAALVAGPGGECREQRPLVDQSVLQGEQTKEKVAIGVDGGHDGGSPEHLEGAAGAWTTTMLSSPAMNQIRRIIAWPLVSRSRALRDQAPGLDVVASGLLRVGRTAGTRPERQGRP